MDSCTPIWRSAVSVETAFSMPFMSTLSVTSSVSCSGFMSAACSERATCETKSGCVSCRLETFTLMRSVALSRIARHSRIWRHASDSTQLPSGTMRPVSSATGMNIAGSRRPRSGWFQRASASKPMSFWSFSVQIGW